MQYKHKCRYALSLVALCGVALGARAARADVIYNGTFEDGTAGSWSAVTGISSVAANNTSPINDSYSLKVTPNNKTNLVYMPFSSVTLDSVGSSLRVNFNFKSLGNADGAFSPALGFYYNSNSTSAVADGSTGYSARTSTGAGTAAYLCRENNTSAGSYILSGADLSIMKTDASGYLGMTANETRNFDFLLTRTATGIDMTLTVSGGNLVSPYTMTYSVSAASSYFYTTFNELAIRDGDTATGAGFNSYQMDNVVITYTPVPESASLSILAFSSLALLCRK